MAILANSIKISLLALVMALGLSACTENGGDTHGWFGTWSIDSITGTANGYGGGAFVQFQNQLVRLSLHDGAHAYTDTYGNFATSGGNLTITFPDPAYPPLALPGLGTTNQFVTVSHSGGRAQLQLADSTASTYLYHLHKVG